MLRCMLSYLKLQRLNYWRFVLIISFLPGSIIYKWNRNNLNIDILNVARKFYLQLKQKQLEYNLNDEIQYLLFRSMNVHQTHVRMVHHVMMKWTASAVTVCWGTWAHCVRQVSTSICLNKPLLMKLWGMGTHLNILVPLTILHNYQ